MGSTLTNGIYLPAEGERNCYAGLASNWTILDGVVGGYSAHAANTTIHVTAADKEAWNGKADTSALTAHTGDTTIHVTAEDKTKWDAVENKADTSALTAHTGDTTIHVTAADKTKWDAVTGKADASALTAHTGNTTIHVTAEDKAKWDAVTSKADDTDVLHKSGDETSTGIKNFVDNIVAKKIVSNVAQLQINARSNADSVAVIAGASAAEGGGIWIYGKNSVNNSHVSIQVYDTVNSTYHAARLNMDGSLTPTVSNKGLGNSSYKWVGINGLNPSALSLPSGNANDVIDISAYITNLDGTANSYTVPANGWISIAVVGTAIAIVSSSWSDSRLRASSGDVRMLYPVLKNETLDISVTGTTLAYARFIPCQGNV